MASPYDITVRLVVEQAQQLSAAVDALKRISGQATLTNATLASMAGQSAQGWQQLNTRLGETNQALRNVQTSGGQAASALQNAFAIDIVGRLNGAVLELTGLFKDALVEGVKYNASLETEINGLAATMRTVSPEKYLNFAAAQQSATVVVDQLRQKATQLGIDFHALAQAYQATLQSMVHGGVTDAAKQIDLVATLLAAAASKGITGARALKDVIGILSGNVGNIVLAKELDFTSHALKEAAKHGETFNYIMSKVGGYKEGLDATANSFSGLWQSVKNELGQMEGILAKPLFDELKAGLAKLKEVMASPEFESNVRTYAILIGGVIEKLKEAAGWLEKLQYLNKFTLEYQALETQTSRYKQVEDSLRQQVSTARTKEQVEAATNALVDQMVKALDDVASKEGKAQEAAASHYNTLTKIPPLFGSAAAGAGELGNAIAADTAELSKFLEKLPQVITGLRRATDAADFALKISQAANATEKLSLTNERFQAVRGQGNELASKMLGFPSISLGSKDLTAAYEQFESMQKSGVKISDAQLEAAKKLQPVISDLNHLENQRKQALVSQSDELKKQGEAVAARERQVSINNLTAGGDKVGADKLARLEDIDKKTKEIMRTEIVDEATARQRATEFVDSENRKKDAIDAEKNARKGAALDAKDEAAADRDRATAVEKIRNALADLKANPFLTDEQKMPIELQLLRDEEAQLQRNIDARKEYIKDHQGDPNFAPKVAQYGAENQRDERRIGQAGTEGRLNTFGGGFESELVKLQNQFSLTGQSIGQTFANDVNVGFNALTQGITGAITKTGNWRQTVLQAEQSIIGSLVNVTLKFIWHYAVLAGQSIANFALGKTLRNQDSTEKKTKAATDTSTQATPSLLESITTYGVAAAIGLAALLAAMAITGSFAEGGPTGPGNKYTVRGVVHANEFVQPMEAHAYYGTDFMEMLRQRQIPREAAYAMLNSAPAGFSSYNYAQGGAVGGNSQPASWVGALSPSGSGRTSSTSATSRNERTRDHHTYVFFDQRAMLEHMRSRDGEKVILDAINNNRVEIGLDRF